MEYRFELVDRRIEEIRQAQAQDFGLIMGALADQRDLLRELVVKMLRMEQSHHELTRGLESYQQRSLEMTDFLRGLIGAESARRECEIEAIHRRLERLENPPAA